MSLCTKLKELFSRLLFGVQPPLSDEEALDPSRAPVFEQKRQQPRGPANRRTAPTLLTLPAEIRDMIYTELGLRDNTFHLIQVDPPDQSPPRLIRPQRLFRHLRCTRPHTPSAIPVIVCPCIHGRPSPVLNDGNGRYNTSAPLLLVCRALYLETIPILYARNTLDVGHRFDLLTTFARAIGPQNLRAIRDLRVSWPMARRDFDSWRGVWPAVEGGVRMLREEMGEQLSLTLLVHLSSQSRHFQVAGLWAGRWWLEPLARLRGGGAAGMEVHVVVCEPRKRFTDGGVAWAAFQEEVERLVQRGEGVQSPWVEFGDMPRGPSSGLLCVPGRFGRETAMEVPQMPALA